MVKRKKKGEKNISKGEVSKKLNPIVCSLN
jgi:hypothetical protein